MCVCEPATMTLMMCCLYHLSHDTTSLVTLLMTLDDSATSLLVNVAPTGRKWKMLVVDTGFAGDLQTEVKI